MAQSSATVDGRVDLSVGRVKQINAGSRTQLIDGNLTSTRLGVKGSENLGGGLKIEHRFDADTGAAEEPM